MGLPEQSSKMCLGAHDFHDKVEDNASFRGTRLSIAAPCPRSEVLGPHPTSRDAHLTLDLSVEVRCQHSLQVGSLGLLQHAERPHQVRQQVRLQAVQLALEQLMDLQSEKPNSSGQCC